MSPPADLVVEPLPVLRAVDLAEPDATRRWLVEDLWTRGGVGIVGGLPKSAKSWLALDMALSVATATPCLDTFEVHDPGSALIYMAEDTASVVKERLLGLCRHRGIDLAAVPIDVITATSLRLDLERDQHRLAETVRQRRPRLLLLDPLVRCHRLDENDAGQVSGLLAYLRALQREHEVAVVVVHHARKNSAAHHGGQSLRGSGDFYAWIDSGLYLRRQGDHLRLTVEHRAAPPRPAVALALVDTDQATTRLEVIDPPSTDGAASQNDDLDDAVLRLVRGTSDPVSRLALRTALRVRNARLGDALARLSTAGAIVKDADGWSCCPVPVPAPTSTWEPERSSPSFQAGKDLSFPHIQPSSRRSAAVKGFVRAKGAERSEGTESP